MGDVTIAPCDEACEAIVARINSATTYTLPQPAEYLPVVVDQLEEVDGLRVDVVHEFEQDLQETLDIEDRTSHIIRIWIRDKLPNDSITEVKSRNLIVRQIWQRVNNFHSINGRVKVWDIGKDRGEIPGKWMLVEASFYRAYIELRVEVEPP